MSLSLSGAIGHLLCVWVSGSFDLLSGRCQEKHWLACGTRQPQAVCQQLSAWLQKDCCHILPAKQCTYPAQNHIRMEQKWKKYCKGFTDGISFNFQNQSCSAPQIGKYAIYIIQVVGGRKNFRGGYESRSHVTRKDFAVAIFSIRPYSMRSQIPLLFSSTKFIPRPAPVQPPCPEPLPLPIPV